MWSGQPIATIPDLSQLVVLTRIRETDLHRIREGLLARLDLEAYPDLAMNGRIDFVGSLAEAAADSPWKFFSVRLLVDRSDVRLRPGMSVRVSLLLDEARAVVVAPVDAVFLLRRSELLLRPTGWGGLGAAGHARRRQRDARRGEGGSRRGGRGASRGAERRRASARGVVAERLGPSCGHGPMPLLSLAGVSRVYGHGARAVRALDDVTLDVERGELRFA